MAGLAKVRDVVAVAPEFAPTAHVARCPVGRSDSLDPPGTMGKGAKRAAL